MKTPQKFQDKTSEADFAKYYANHVAPLHEDIEDQRQKLILKQKRNGPIAIILATLSSIIIIFAKIKFFPYCRPRRIGKAIVGIYMFFWSILVSRHKKNYIIAAKNKLLPAFIKFFGNFSYSGLGNFPSNHAPTFILNKLIDLVSQ